MTSNQTFVSAHAEALGIDEGYAKARLVALKQAREVVCGKSRTPANYDLQDVARFVAALVLNPMLHECGPVTRSYLDMLRSGLPGDAPFLNGTVEDELIGILACLCHGRPGEVDFERARATQISFCTTWHEVEFLEPGEAPCRFLLGGSPTHWQGATRSVTSIAGASLASVLNRLGWLKVTQGTTS